MVFRPPPIMSASGAGQGANNGKVLNDGRTLQVEGLVVDTIDEVVPFGSSVDTIIHQLADLKASVSQAWQRPCNFDPAIAPLMQKFRASEPLWRILVSNTDKKLVYEAAPLSYRETYLSFLNRSGLAYENHVARKYTNDHHRPAFEVSLRSCVGSKSFFTTKSGFVGTCVPASHKGDIVVIVFGSPAPFVLRPVPQLEGEQQAYSLVGASYVGGIMGGEIVDELYCEDLMDSTTFLLR
jgi:hypothetical protein